MPSDLELRMLARIAALETALEAMEKKLAELEKKLASKPAEASRRVAAKAEVKEPGKK